jgi:hypothetical protein
MAATPFRDDGVMQPGFVRIEARESAQYALKRPLDN